MKDFFLIFVIVLPGSILAQSEVKDECLAYKHYGRPHTYLSVDGQALEKGNLKYSCSKPAKPALSARKKRKFKSECRSFISSAIECSEISGEIKNVLKEKSSVLNKGISEKFEGYPYFTVKGEK